MKKQVDMGHYSFDKYLTKGRWASMWHQLDEVLKIDPKNVLEIGPGPGVFRAMASALGVHVETLDIDPELKPDHVGSVFNLPFKDNSFDVVCAFQMLEHLPYEKSLIAYSEILRVARRGVVISLPDAKRLLPIVCCLPKIGWVSLSIPFFRLGLKQHVFDGEHFWEVNKKNYPLKRVIKDFSNNKWCLKKTFRVYENPYHRFFVFKRSVNTD